MHNHVRQVSPHDKHLWCLNFNFLQRPELPTKFTCLLAHLWTFKGFIPYSGFLCTGLDMAVTLMCHSPIPQVEEDLGSHVLHCLQELFIFGLDSVEYWVYPCHSEQNIFAVDACLYSFPTSLSSIEIFLLNHIPYPAP